MAETPTPAATSQPTETGSDNLGRLSEIFGDDAGSQDTAEPTQATAVADEPVESQEDEGDAAVSDETESGDDESSLLPNEDESDFSDDVYSRYAAHFKKTHGIEIDINDPKDRTLLRENILRGQALARQKSEEKTGDADEAVPVDETQPQTAQPTQETPEQIQEFISNIGRYAEKRVRPEVAQVFANEFFKSVWPKEVAEGKLKITPETSVNLTKAFMKFGVLMMNDTLPDILQSYLPKLMGAQYPMLGDIHESRIEESAIDQLESMKDRSGQPLYGDLDDLVESGAIARVMKENPQIREMKWKDPKSGKLLGPVEQAVYRQKFAIRLARADVRGGKGADVKGLVKSAVEAGKKQASNAQRRAANGRLSPGESQGHFSKGATERDAFLTDLVAGGESKLSVAAKQAERGRGK